MARWCGGFLALYLVCLVLCLLFPTLGRPTRRYGHAPTRTCFANQKTLAGAVEMFNLDFNTQATELTAARLEELRASGYLQAIPIDPGSRRTDTYALITAGDGIICLVHGAIRPKNRGTSPRQQLLDLGVTDASLLARASPTLPPDELPPLQDPFRAALYLWLSVVSLVLVPPLWVLAAFHVLLFQALGPLALPLVALELKLVLGWLEGRVNPPRPSAEELGPIDLARARCPVCAEGFHSRAPVACCPRCRTPHHEDCLGWVGGCGRYGCGDLAGAKARADEQAAKAAAASAVEPLARQPPH